MQSDLLYKRILIALLAQEYERVTAHNRLAARSWRAKNPKGSYEITKRNRQRHPGSRKREYANARERYWLKHPLLAQQAEYKRTHPAEVKLQAQERKREKNKAKWRAMTPEQRTAYRAYQNQWVKDRCAKDPVFRMMRSFRCRLAIFITRPYKKSGMNELIGCTGQELRKHIESLWQPGMSWENFGRDHLVAGERAWQCDHVVPLLNFDLTNPEELKKAWHYTNLQPLWQKENLEKPKRVSATANHPT